MRVDLTFGPDGEIIVVYEHFFNVTSPTPSDCEWLIPGTHPDDPSHHKA